MIPQTNQFAGIVLEQLMAPDRIGTFAAILRHGQADRFIRPEFGPCQVFRFTPRAETRSVKCTGILAFAY